MFDRLVFNEFEEAHIEQGVGLASRKISLQSPGMEKRFVLFVVALNQEFTFLTILSSEI